MNTVTVTPMAQKKLREFIKDFELPYVRIGRMTTGGGCCAKLKLGVTLDDSIRDSDQIVHEGDLTILVEKSLLGLTTEYVVDFVDNGLTVTITMG